MSNFVFEISNAQYCALEKAKETFGRRWKSKLQACWETGMYPRSLSPSQAELQQVRNLGGATWLTRFRFEG